MMKFGDIKQADENESLWLDEYSNTLKRVSGGFEYENCSNVALISEASFARLIEKADDDNLDAAIITAYRYGYSLKENIRRNRILRTTLNQNKMGAYQLVGHFKESVPNSDVKVDVIERSYFVVRPESMEFEVFVKLIQPLMTIEGDTQDSILLKKQKTWFLMNSDGDLKIIGTHITIGKIAQVYSQSVLKINTPFVIEGMEVPQSGRVAMYLFKKNNVLYISPFHKLNGKLL